MNVTVERVGNDATLKITLPAEEVNKGYKKAVAKIAGQVNIPGFRKGKAPRNVIEMHYGKEAVKHKRLLNWLPTSATPRLWNRKNSFRFPTRK